MATAQGYSQATGLTFVNAIVSDQINVGSEFQIDDAGLDLPPGSITNTELADDAVTGPKIATQTIETDNIALTAVTQSRIGNFEVANDKL